MLYWRRDERDCAQRLVDRRENGPVSVCFGFLAPRQASLGPRALIARHLGLNALASVNRHGRPGPELVVKSWWPGDRQSRSGMLGVNG